MKDDTFREEIGKKGRLKVIREFNLEYIVKDLSNYLRGKILIYGIF